MGGFFGGFSRRFFWEVLGFWDFLGGVLFWEVFWRLWNFLEGFWTFLGGSFCFFGMFLGVIFGRFLGCFWEVLEFFGRYFLEVSLGDILGGFLGGFLGVFWDFL